MKPLFREDSARAKWRSSLEKLGAAAAVRQPAAAAGPRLGGDVDVRAPRRPDPTHSSDTLVAMPNAFRRPLSLALCLCSIAQNHPLCLINETHPPSASAQHRQLRGACAAADLHRNQCASASTGPCSLWRSGTTTPLSAPAPAPRLQPTLRQHRASSRHSSTAPPAPLPEQASSSGSSS